MLDFDKNINRVLNDYLSKLENHLQADVIFYYGEIHPAFEKRFRDFVEVLKKEQPVRDRVAIILNTGGGSAETVEKMVDIIRHHYKEVYFIVPDYAMSAGTILCMSGDKIFMDYSSSLGPIDPQLELTDGRLYPALGYLDKVNELIAKSKAGTISPVEFAMMQNLDLAQLRSYEMANNLTIELLKEWLVKYKFKNWTTHRTTNPGAPVTENDKIERAAQIATDLSNNKKWHSHGRNINLAKLKELRLEIEDYSNDAALRTLIRDYNDMVTDFIARTPNLTIFMHNRAYF